MKDNFVEFSANLPERPSRSEQPASK